MGNCFSYLTGGQVRGGTWEEAEIRFRVAVTRRDWGVSISIQEYCMWLSGRGGEVLSLLIRSVIIYIQQPKFIQFNFIQIQFILLWKLCANKNIKLNKDIYTEIDLKRCSSPAWSWSSDPQLIHLVIVVTMQKYVRLPKPC